MGALHGGARRHHRWRDRGPLAHRRRGLHDDAEEEDGLAQVSVHQSRSRGKPPPPRRRTPPSVNPRAIQPEKPSALYGERPYARDYRVCVFSSVSFFSLTAELSST